MEGTTAVTAVSSVVEVEVLLFEVTSMVEKEIVGQLPCPMGVLMIARSSSRMCFRHDMKA